MTQEAAAPAQVLTFETRKTPQETTVVCVGKVTSSTSPLLYSTVQPLIAGSKRILLDLTDVTYVDSSGIGVLVRLWIGTKRENCELKVVNLNERIKDLLRISNLSKILEGDQEYHKYLGA
jgi:anti-sigma B factor antagonist